jgi:hypothetical protein
MHIGSIGAATAHAPHFAQHAHAASPGAGTVPQATDADGDHDGSVSPTENSRPAGPGGQVINISA